MSRTLICAIQIGTSRICGAAAWRDQIGNYEIAAIESEHSQGCVRKGCIVNVDTTAAHIKSIVHKLNNRIKSAECRGIEAAYVGINSISMHSQQYHPSVVLEDGRSVNTEIISALRQQSLNQQLDDIDILGLEPMGYTLDDIDCLNPNGRTGSLLIAHHQLIVGQLRIRQGVNAAMEKAGIRLINIIATPLSVSQILTADEKQRGCCLIDMGHSLTSVSIYVNGSLRHLATIPLGGDAVTQDLATSKGITHDEAEKTKISQEALDMATKCRYEEIAANILNQIERSGYRDQLAAGCILTGGASLQRGVISLLSEQLGISRIMARGYSDIRFGLSDRKPQLSGITTMISYCTVDCETKLVEIPAIETKQSPETENKEESQDSDPIQYPPRRNTLKGFFSDLFSGIDD